MVDKIEHNSFEITQAFNDHLVCAIISDILISSEWFRGLPLLKLRIDAS